MSKNKQANVLITVGAGCLGSVLAPTLLKKGFGVKVLDNFFLGQSSLMGCCSHGRFRVIWSMSAISICSKSLWLRRILLRLWQNWLVLHYAIWVNPVPFPPPDLS
jgi:UDP-glucose 4-epimerase